MIYVPESERSGREPLFKTTLPQDASGFEGHAGTFSGGLALEGREVAFWGPLYPGEQALEFSLGVAGQAAPTPAFSRAVRRRGEAAERAHARRRPRLRRAPARRRAAA